MNRYRGKVETSSIAHEIVFFDMDGTLYQTKNDIIQEPSLRAIQALRGQGYIVYAATSRPPNQMDLTLERVQFDYMVMINGGYALGREQCLLFKNPLNKQTTQDIAD